MLRSLTISNYILINSLDIDFSKGFSAITGETGAGKSIIIGAISALLGARLDKSKVKQGASKCVIEAEFTNIGPHATDFFRSGKYDLDDGSCIIRREISSSGKSRAFINDTPSSVTDLSDLGHRLIDIHSQHQNLLLQSSSFLTDVLDSLSSGKDLDNYKDLWTKYSLLNKEVNDLKILINKQEEELDYIKYSVEQIESAHLEKDEQSKLEEEENRLSHAKDITDGLSNVVELLDGENGNIAESLSTSRRSLAQISSFITQAGPWSNRIESLEIELRDITEDIRSTLEDMTYDPERLSQIENRLSQIYDLERKFHTDSYEDLLFKYDELQASLSESSDHKDELKEKERKLETLLYEATAAAQKVSENRHKAAGTLASELMTMLSELGMPKARINVSIEPLKQLSPNGMDNIRFLFASTQNATMQDVGKIASGGESARIMLCLKAIIARKKQLPAIIFDEIDTGVSGRIAESMGRTMKEISGENDIQVICITHLPQIASQGNTQYLVYKSGDEAANTNIKKLTPKERIVEIAKMLSGNKVTDAAMQNAMDLLNNQRS